MAAGNAVAEAMAVAVVEPDGGCDLVGNRDLDVGGGRGEGRCRYCDGGRDEGDGAMAEVAVAVLEAAIVAVAEPVAVAVTVGEAVLL